jgi:hypothetical protein
VTRLSIAPRIRKRHFNIGTFMTQLCRRHCYYKQQRYNSEKNNDKKDFAGKLPHYLRTYARLEQHKKLDLVAEEIEVAKFKVKCEGNLTVK